MFMKIIHEYPFALQECLSHDAQQQYENTNASKKELKLNQDIFKAVQHFRSSCQEFVN